MASSGNTTTRSLEDSLDLIVNSARLRHEYVGVMRNTVEIVQLEDNTGEAWKEILIEKLNAQRVTEDTELDNPQQYTDSAIAITPEMTQILTFMTDRARARASAVTLRRMGDAMENALARKEDEDLIVIIDGATTSLGSSGTFTSGQVRASRFRITSNTTEPAPMGDEIFTVHHGLTLKDIEDEIVTVAGTGEISQGLTAEVYQRGIRVLRMMADTVVLEDSNIPVSSNVAKGGTWARSAIVHVEGMRPLTETVRKPGRGGGGDEIYMRREYASGERGGGQWLYEHQNDATVPTS